MSVTDLERIVGVTALRNLRAAFGVSTRANYGVEATPAQHVIDQTDQLSFCRAG
jgi:hypothetical protein